MQIVKEEPLLLLLVQTKPLIEATFAYMFTSHVICFVLI